MYKPHYHTTILHHTPHTRTTPFTDILAHPHTCSLAHHHSRALPTNTTRLHTHTLMTTHSLLLYGALLVQLRAYEKAEAFLRSVVDIDNSQFQAHALLVSFFVHTYICNHFRSNNVSWKLNNITPSHTTPLVHTTSPSGPQAYTYFMMNLVDEAAEFQQRATALFTAQQGTCTIDSTCVLFTAPQGAYGR